ncbi:hypothetical protein ACLMJK_001478 [Lecanora helva]
MSQSNPLNVYKGQDGLREFFNPDSQPPLPLVELPEKLNPFFKDNVRIYAKMLTALPAQNVKALPALNMLLHDPAAAKKSIIEASSGSTCTSLSISARVLYDNNDTCAFISNKTEMNRIRQLQFFGLKVALYGGPAQPEITDPRGIIIRAQEMAKSNPDRICNPGQYENEHNWQSHVRWTGPQLWKQIPEINVFCMGMGSAGCVTGTGSFLKEKKPSVKVIGVNELNMADSVCNAVNDPVPGPRPFPLFDSCNFPWREVVDAVEISSSVDSYRLSMQLSREGLVAGPSTGMTLKGLFRWLEKTKDAGELDAHREPESGQVNCVFICCDLPQQYMQGYFARLSADDFRPIQNEELLAFDTDKYDLKWELSATEAISMLKGIIHNSQHDFADGGKPVTMKMPSGKNFNPIIFDLRTTKDYAYSHLPGALSTPLEGLDDTTPSPIADFTKTDVLRQQWMGLRAKFSGQNPEIERILGGRLPTSAIVILCYSGESSRIASAVLRTRGLEAFSVKGGMQALSEALQAEHKPKENGYKEPSREKAPGLSAVSLVV